MDSQPVKQGAIIGGWLCFAIGMGLMWYSLWLLPVFAAFLFAAFVLSIIAMAQRRVVGGILLLLLTVTVSPLTWIKLTGERVDAHFAEHSSEAYEAGKLVGRAIVQETVGGEVSKPSEPAVPTALPDHRTLKPTPPPPPEVLEALVAAPATPSRVPSAPEPTDESAESPAMPAVKPAPVASRDNATLINTDTVPIVYELKAAAPTPRVEIADFVTGGGFRKLDEFARREFLEKLNQLISDKKAEYVPERVFRWKRRAALGEYNFDTSAFPIGDAGEGKPSTAHMIPDGRGRVEDGPYGVAFVNAARLTTIPSPIEEARLLGPILRKSRIGDVTYSGRLVRCEAASDRYGNAMRIVYLEVSEVTVQLQEGGNLIVYHVPSEPAAQAAPPSIVPAPEPSAPAPRVVAQPAAAPTGSPGGLRSPEQPPAAETLSPAERTVAGVPTGDTLNVRSAPAQNSDAKFNVNNGDRVQILGEAVKNGDTEWVPIGVGSQRGWVRSKFLRPAL